MNKKVSKLEINVVFVYMNLLLRRINLWNILCLDLDVNTDMKIKIDEKFT